MSGHSKWANIKHRKAQQDSKKGKVYTRIIKELMVAARHGGGDPDANPRLRMALQSARASNMPNDTIKRAIAKGSGQLEGSTMEEVIYEGYGAGGIAVLIEALTDNKNRTVGEIRHIFSRNAGNVAEAGCVAWMFSKKGYVAIPKTNADEDTLLGLLLDAGIDDLSGEDSEYWEIYCQAGVYERVLTVLKENSITIDSSELAMLPKTYMQVSGKHAQQVLNLVEALEDHDDVQKVWTNLDIPDEQMQELSKE